MPILSVVDGGRLRLAGLGGALGPVGRGGYHSFGHRGNHVVGTLSVRLGLEAHRSTITLLNKVSSKRPHRHHSPPSIDNLIDSQDPTEDRQKLSFPNH